MLTRRAFLAGTAGAFLPSQSPMMGPILAPDEKWEGTCAMPFGGGIHKTRNGYRCYYLANFTRICLALSYDGLVWDKRDLGIFPGTNILLQHGTMDSFSVWPHAGTWHMIISERGGGKLRLLTSVDGVFWAQQAEMPWAGDRTTLWYNPIKERWTFNVRAGQGTGFDPRRIDRVESETFIPKQWKPERWLTAMPNEGADFSGSVQLYAVDVVPDGNRLIGLFTIWRGLEDNRPKSNDVCLGFSSDGDSFDRQYLPTLTRGAPGDWNYGNVQSCTGGVHKVNGVYRLYASGRKGVPGTQENGICSLGYREVATL